MSTAVSLAVNAPFERRNIVDVPFTPAASDHQPPRFLPAVALYINRRFVKMEVGRLFQITCKDALDDTRTAIAKANENGPPGTLAIGLCIPVPTYDPADLSEGAGQQEPPPAKVPNV